jgi:hypothetical protein
MGVAAQIRRRKAIPLQTNTLCPLTFRTFRTFRTAALLRLERLEPFKI